MELSIAAMLRLGVTLAAVFVLAGGALALRHPWTTIPSYRLFHAGDASLRTLPGIMHGLLRLEPGSIVQFGLVVLIATPVARVVFCVVGFGRQRDALYVAISLAVLLVLVYSLTFGVR